MPIQVTCFTCGKYIQKKYIDEYIPACNRYKQQQDNEDGKSPEYLALRDLGIWRFCCRKTFLSIHCIDNMIL